VRATYRLQLTASFGFAEAAAVVPYLRDLGISHLYLSPIFASKSDHGYDVTDPRIFNPRLGSFDTLVAAGTPMIVDIVPNHMSASDENPWWADVQRNGRDSEYARVFDLDFDTGRYRRFFDINELVAVRVEDPWVFELTHSFVIDLVRRGVVAGVRVDHVDGLRDPGAYLRRLRDALGPDAYIVVEKIGEAPADWPIDGTTGYDFLAVADGLFVDPDGVRALARDWPAWPEVRERAKRDVLAGSLAGEIPDELVEKTVALDVYRTYGEGDPSWEQRTPAVMAKGLEDTAFYRYPVLLSRNEVGTEPVDTTTIDAFHAFAAERKPTTMNASSTHDTKRSEDVRARIDVLSEIPDEWRALTARWNERYRPSINRRDVEIFYQSMIGAQPDVERMWIVMQKSIREAKDETGWARPDEAYERAVEGFVRHVMRDEAFLREVDAFVERIGPAALANSLGRVVLKIFTPGVPDFYQGCEDFNYRLVDPDNRAPASFDASGVKYELIKRLLAMPRKGAYEPVEVTGCAAGHVIAFRRGAVLVVVSRLVAKLDGWGDTAVEGRPVGELLAELPVAVVTPD
jgi:(1->4)-alpha-D-glucan 1-alpha-D-glucosylmutase